MHFRSHPSSEICGFQVHGTSLQLSMCISSEEVSLMLSCVRFPSDESAYSAIFEYSLFSRSPSTWLAPPILVLSHLRPIYALPPLYGILYVSLPSVPQLCVDGGTLCCIFNTSLCHFNLGLSRTNGHHDLLVSIFSLNGARAIYQRLYAPL